MHQMLLKNAKILKCSMLQKMTAKDQQILFTKFTKQIHGVEELFEQ